MYEIATLKTKKLPELQEIAKKIGVKRITGLNKLDLIYQIVDFIASKPEEEADPARRDRNCVAVRRRPRRHEWHPRLPFLREMPARGDQPVGHDAERSRGVPPAERRE